HTHLLLPLPTIPTPLFPAHQPPVSTHCFSVCVCVCVCVCVGPYLCFRMSVSLPNEHLMGWTKATVSSQEKPRQTFPDWALFRAFIKYLHITVWECYS